MSGIDSSSFGAAAPIQQPMSSTSSRPIAAHFSRPSLPPPPPPSPLFAMTHIVNHLKANGITAHQNTNIDWKNLDSETSDFINNLKKSLTPGGESLLHSLSEDLTSLPASTRNVLQPILASLCHLQRSKASSATATHSQKNRPISEQNAKKYVEERNAQITKLLENAKNPKLTNDEMLAHIGEAKKFLNTLKDLEPTTKKLRIELEVLVGNLKVRAGGGAQKFGEMYMLKHALAQDLLNPRK